MTSFRFLFPVLLVLSGLIITSCEKNEHDMHEDATDVQQPENRSLAGGLIFMDESEYNTIPEIDMSNLESLSPENEIETRSSYRRLNTPPVISQGKETSCTAFAASYCVSSYYTSALRSMPYTNSQAIRSPEYVFNSTKLAGECNKAGAYLNHVLNFIRDKGVCSWSQMPYSDTNGCSQKPNNTQISQGVIGKIKSWNTVAKNVNSVKDLIKLGYPVVMGFDANSNFDKQTLKAPYIYTSYKADANYAGHAVTIIGYDDVKKHFIVQNSWGTMYHDKGIFYVTYNLFPTIARELYVMHPFFPGNIKIRHASKVNEITFKMNGATYLIKKGQTLSVPAKLTTNKYEMWECIFNGQYQDCKWDSSVKPEHSKNYKIVDLSKNYDLNLVKE